MPLKYITDNFDQLNTYLDSDEDLFGNDEVADQYQDEEDQTDDLVMDDEEITGADFGDEEEQA